MPWAIDSEHIPIDADNATIDGLLVFVERDVKDAESRWSFGEPVGDR